MTKTKNRWLIALAGVGLHISIGSVYAWSVFTSPLQEEIGWTLSEVSLIFSIAIFFLGVSAAFMGHFVEKHGPRKSGLISTLFFASGLALSGFAVSIENLYLLYLGYGVLGGIGLGIGYITPVSTLVKWFPDRRGMATGLAIMGFGFAAMIASPVMSSLINSVGISNTFYIMASVYFVIMICASLYLEKPADGYHPKGLDLNKTTTVKKDYVQLLANEAIKTRRFYFLWFMLFINVTCGIAILAVASPMGQEVAGLTPAAAAVMVGIMGVFNGGGRLIWATISDYIGRPNLYTTFFILQIVIFALLPFTSNALLFMLMLFIMISCYGGGFSAIPAYIADLFGTKQLGAIHGYILTAWAMAGLVGPFIVSKVREATNSYNLTLYLFVAFFVVALVISILIRQDIKKIKAESETIQGNKNETAPVTS
ncbi:OFA family MFS transporter [Phocicoccus pinnipedialis]|uniref:L-lactate transporter n=1 Tax=Phocicoccus pinnipedialis TaxID=110845 RepID=A0A6V7R4W5_9BACL|nr:OFA family MFS transporter [Jeotgalicoccus pinnipedialis]MBP1939800.1 OFA family oxalate/formate antiporter-like MFS transporter [Jeotgalicoccus pinnipedialis]CAD2072430.1 L-lactate transporter [Jeotgalicoccus pinnipedialis]